MLPKMGHIHFGKTLLQIYRYLPFYNNALFHDILRVLSVSIDDKPITIKGYEWVLKNKHNIYDLCVYFDEQSFFLYPIEKLEDGKKVEIDYKYIFQRSPFFILISNTKSNKSSHLKKAE